MPRIETTAGDTRTIRYAEPDEEIRGGSFGYIIYSDREVTECIGEEAMRLPATRESTDFGDTEIPF